MDEGKFEQVEVEVENPKVTAEKVKEFFEASFISIKV